MRIAHHPRRLALFLTLALACLATWLPRTAGAAPAPEALKEQTLVIPSLSAQGLLDLIRANQGKGILINFFATWCPPCREEIPDLVKLRKEYAEKDLMIIGLSLDEDTGKLNTFAKLAGFNYPIYQATDEIAPIIGISSIPHNMIYNRQGQLVFSEAGMVDVATLRTFMDALLKDDKQKAGKSGKSGGTTK